ncbi:MAG: hypothetical protein ACRD1S_08940 [Vicinamibacterales bacterium]
MRTSGAGTGDALMFVAPALIFVGFFLWLTGGPTDALATIDQFLRRAAFGLLDWVKALLG